MHAKQFTEMSANELKVIKWDVNNKNNPCHWNIRPISNKSIILHI